MDKDEQKKLGNEGENGKSDGKWIEAEEPKDPNEIRLDVDEEFEGLYMETKPSPVFKDRVVHMFRVKDEKDEKYMYGKSNLDKWLEPVPPGTKVKIKRLKDVHITNQPKPLQKFKLWTWEKNS